MLGWPIMFIQSSFSSFVTEASRVHLCSDILSKQHNKQRHLNIIKQMRKENFMILQIHLLGGGILVRCCHYLNKQWINYFWQFFYQTNQSLFDTLETCNKIDMRLVIELKVCDIWGGGRVEKPFHEGKSQLKANPCNSPGQRVSHQSLQFKTYEVSLKVSWTNLKVR